MILDSFRSCSEWRAGCCVGVETPAGEADLWGPRAGPVLMHRLHATSTRGERRDLGPFSLLCWCRHGVCVGVTPSGLCGVLCGNEQPLGFSKGRVLQTWSY